MCTCCVVRPGSSICAPSPAGNLSCSGFHPACSPRFTFGGFPENLQDYMYNGFTMPDVKSSQSNEISADASQKRLNDSGHCTAQVQVHRFIAVRESESSEYSGYLC